MRLVSLILMDNCGEQRLVEVEVGCHSVQCVAETFLRCMRALALETGRKYMYRAIEELDSRWQKGLPPITKEYTIWMVKVDNPNRPEEIVVSNDPGEGFVRLCEYIQPSQFGLQGITHHRRLTPEEEKFLMQDKN